MTRLDLWLANNLRPGSMFEFLFLRRVTRKGYHIRRLPTGRKVFVRRKRTSVERYEQARELPPMDTAPLKFRRYEPFPVSTEPALPTQEEPPNAQSPNAEEAADPTPAGTGYAGPGPVGVEEGRF